MSWFKRLTPEFISLFIELRNVFLERYMIISDRLYTANNLSAIREQPDEKLMDCITGFNNEYVRCEGCDKATTYNALMGDSKVRISIFLSYETFRRRIKIFFARPPVIHELCS